VTHPLDRLLPVLWARLLLLAALGAGTWLALTPPSGPIQAVDDKLLHGVAFFVLALLADRALPALRFLPWIAAVLLLYGIGIELAQSLLPYREFSVLDMGANAAGLGGYWLVAWLWARWRVIRAIR
jgi:VanZ family protein